MAKASYAGSFGAVSGPNGRLPRLKRFSRAVVDALEPRRLLAPWITTEVAGAVCGQAGDVEVADGKAYVLMGGLTILDVSGTGTPVQLGHLNVSAGRGVTVLGSYAYIWRSASADPSFQIVDVSDPARPAVVGSCLVGIGVSDAWVVDSYAYLISGVRVSNR